MLDSIWLEAAQTLDVPVTRAGDAYVHWDGRTLFIAGDEHLDDDDTVAQLVLHELCHWITQGSDARALPDWGLDNTSERDADRELSCVRLQAHLLGAFGLRSALFPTTPLRDFFSRLGDDALATDPLAHAAASRAARAPFAAVLREALERSAATLALEQHATSGRPLKADRECGDCVWRTAGGFCRQARRRVAAVSPACTAFEPQLDCQSCGACCREAYDTVELSAREAARIKLTSPSLIEARHGRLHLRRAPGDSGDRCAALDGFYSCNSYALRPRSCRDFERAGRHCLTARQRVGLTL